MTENDSDPEDEFEDQLADISGRAQEKISDSDRKKAEKLGVSPASPDERDADDDRETEVAREPQRDADDIDEGLDDGTPSREDPPVPDGQTAGASHAEVDSSRGDEAGEAEHYEYRSMTADADRSAEPANAPESPGDIEGALAGIGGRDSGTRMAVTKSESSFVIGEHDVTADVEERKLLYFELNDELFAGSIDRVSSVEEVPGLTRYPRSPEPIDGVTDMRGKIIAVLNPKVIVNLSGSDDTAHGANGEYIIVQNEREDEHRLGIRVDDISHVETVTEEDITSIHDISEMDLLTIDEDYLEGIVHGYRADDEKTVPLVDFESLTESLKKYA